MKKITDDADVLLEFFRYPAEHWIHRRTTNPIARTQMQPAHVGANRVEVRSTGPGLVPSPERDPNTNSSFFEGRQPTDELKIQTRSRELRTDTTSRTENSEK
ncbi:hypothetical protein ACFTZB_12620 [Rhodococcus sp. NPDC057014]|uniref:hypothetical protein n=1 Tax=Rhodococcus sp. NPDC057014 TaxID=3346000 RepID=UPI00362862C2